jgi:hypothetical protein
MTTSHLDTTDRPLTDGRVPAVTRIISLALGVIFTLLAVRHVQVRPPCAEHYVRLLDLDGALRFLGGALVIGQAAVLAVCWRPGRHPFGTAMAVLLGVVALGGCLVAGQLLGMDGRHQPVGCWTF